MPLSGNLEDFEITDVLQVIHLSNKDGVLHIKGEKGDALMYFKGGLLLHAEAHGSEGMSAVQKILVCRKGTFEFRPGEVVNKTSIQMPIQNVILEAARQIDEWKQMEKVIPSVNVIVNFVEEPEMSNIELSADEWKILTTVDGKKSLKEIAKELGLEEFLVARTLYGLISSGLLKVIGEKEEEHSEEEEKEKNKRRGGGFFRRR